MNRPKEGALLRVDLSDGTDAFARVLRNSQLAFYGVRVPHAAHIDLTKVYESEILFIVTVMKSVLTSGRWGVVDSRPLGDDLLAPNEYYLKDALTGRFSVYRSTDGSSRDSTLEECKYLEAAAVWESGHLEERLRDYFEGRHNQWAEQLRAKP